MACPGRPERLPEVDFENISALAMRSPAPVYDGPDEYVIFVMAVLRVEIVQ